MIFLKVKFPTLPRTAREGWGIPECADVAGAKMNYEKQF